MVRIIDMLCGLIDALLAKKPPETAHQYMDCARGMAIRSYILQNLGDPILSAERIMQKFAASRATIYREFQSDGGIARFITIK